MKLIAAGFALALTGSALGQCGPSTYLLAPRPMTWQDGQAYAKSLGGYLICTADGSEQGEVLKLLPSGPYWLGLTDEAIEGDWAWVSGEPVTYTNWNGGEPSDGNNNDYARGCINCGGWAAYPSPIWDGRPSLASVIVEIPAGPNPDLNGDGRVNGIDLANVLGTWGVCSGACLGDADCSGNVDGTDLAIVLGAWTG